MINRYSLKFIYSIIFIFINIPCVAITQGNPIHEYFGHIEKLLIEKNYDKANQEFQKLDRSIKEYEYTSSRMRIEPVYYMTKS